MAETLYIDWAEGTQANGRWRINHFIFMRMEHVIYFIFVIFLLFVVGNRDKLTREARNWTVHFLSG